MRPHVFNKVLAVAMAMMLTGIQVVAGSPRAAKLLVEGAEMPLDTVAANASVEALRAITPPPKPRWSMPCIYDEPYSINASYPNWRRLAGNTAVLFAGGITALVVLSVLPEDATAWNRHRLEKTPFWDRYYNNVMRPPHIDDDNAIFNYILHPYAGAAYYMSARSQGFNLWQSWLYSFAISTFFWEYGIEAFMERPSIQDLIITPMGGMILGEAFYLAKRKIVENDYYLLGTRWLGYPVAFLLDPVNECLGWFRGNRAHGYSDRVHRQSSQVSFVPSIAPTRGGSVSYGFNLQIAL